MRVTGLGGLHSLISYRRDYLSGPVGCVDRLCNKYFMNEKRSRADKILQWVSLVIIPLLGIAVSAAVAIITLDRCPDWLGFCGSSDPQPRSTAPVSASDKTPTPIPTPTPTPDNQPPVKAADPAPDNRYYGPYFLYNRITKKCADLPGREGGQEDGPVNQSTCEEDGPDNQEWWLYAGGKDAAGNQLYWIQNADDKLCIDPPGKTTVQPRTELNEAICADGDNQYFRLELRKTLHNIRYYWLRNTVADDMCLDVSGDNDGGVDTRLALFPCRATHDHEWALIEKSKWSQFVAGE